MVVLRLLNTVFQINRYMNMKQRNYSRNNILYYSNKYYCVKLKNAE